MTILSVLIPAYNYPDGVRSILSMLSHNTSSELEIIIADDSSNEFVSQAVDAFRHLFLVNFNYRRNYPALGAVSNWNSLLDQASGEFVLLLHHDEYPLDDQLVRSAIELLEKNSGNIDVVVMDCMLTSSRGQIVRPHLPRIIRHLVIKYFPLYLFKRNVLGPTSCLIVRKSLYPRFDICLRWLVDVELYYRLRQITSRWGFSKDLRIASRLGRKDSITASLNQELKNIDEQERIYLIQKYPEAERWLVASNHRLLNFVELIAWASMRVITKGFYQLLYALK